MSVKKLGPTEGVLFDNLTYRIEVTNTGTTPMNLLGVRISQAIDFTFGNLLLGGGFGRKSKPDFASEAACLRKALRPRATVIERANIELAELRRDLGLQVAPHVVAPEVRLGHR